MPDPVVENIPASLPADQVAFFTSVKSGIEFLLGHGRNLASERALRVKELKNLGIDTDTFFNYSQKDPYPLVASSSESGEVPDAPTDMVIVKGAFSNTIQWTNPTDPIVWYIEIWAAESSQELSDAHPAGIVTVTDLNRGKPAEFIHSGIDVAKDHTYWIRSFSYGQKYSEWHPSLVQGGLTVQADASIAQTIDEVINVLQGGAPATYDPGRVYDVDERCRTNDGRVWKSRISLNQGNDPAASPAQWERTGILMQGDVDGTPTVAIDGNLVVDDTILARHLQAEQVKAAHIDTKEVFVGLTIQSSNYIPGTSGWKINKDGDFEINGGSISIGPGSSGYDNLTDTPVSLGEIDPAANTKLSGIQAGADVTSDNTAAAISGQGALATRNSVNGTYIDGNSVTTSHLRAGAVTAATVGTNKIITQSANIGTAVVDNANIKNLAVTEAKIGNLAATEAKIGNLAVSTGKIKNLAISTLKLANQAVTIPVSAYTAASHPMSHFNTWYTVQSATIVSSGAPIMIMGYIVVTYSDRYNDISIALRLYRGNTIILEYPTLRIVSTGGVYRTQTTFVPFFISDTPGSGTHIYKINCKRYTYPSPVGIQNRSLLLLETKK